MQELKNKDANVLTRISIVLHSISHKVVGIECLKDDFLTYLDFGII